MAPTLDAVSTIAAAAGTGPVVGTRPAGMATGQLEVALVGARENTGEITCGTAGWVQVGDEAFQFEGVRLTWWRHAYTLGDPAPSFSSTLGDHPDAGTDPNGVFVIMGRVSGHDPATPIDVATVLADGDSQTMTAGSITTVTDDALVLAGFMSSNDVAHATPGNGATLVTNQLSNVASQCGMSIVRKAIPANGPTGAFTLQQADSSRYQWTAITLAIRPAATGVAGTAAAPLGGMTATAAATVTPAAASAAAPLGGMTATASATRTTSATATAALGRIVAAASAVKTVAASASAQLGALSAAALGTGVSYLGAAGVSLNPVVWLVDRDTLDITGPPLGFWETLELSPIANSPGSCRLVYPAGADRFDELFGNVSASPQRDQEIEVWLAGSDDTRTRWLLQQKDGDDLHPGQLWVFDGVGLEALLAEVLVGPQDTETQELLFSGVTYGTILITALQQAQERDGVLEGVTWDFTTTHDSDGTPWANTVSDLAFAPDDSLLAVAEVGPTEAFGEFAMGPDRVLHAWNYGARGTDRSTGTNPLRLQAAANLTAAARRESSRPGDAATATLAKGAEGQYQWATDPTAEAQRGRRVEVAVDAGQSASEGGVLAAAQGQLEVLKTGVAERTHGVVFGPGMPLPGLDYDVADWGLSITGNQVRAERIAQWTLLFRRGERASGTVRTNTRIQTRLDRLRRELERVRRGAAIVGTSTHSPEVDDGKPPAQVTGVTASSSAYFDADGGTQAAVLAGWSAVTTNDDGTATDDIASYLLQYRYTGGGELPGGWQPTPPTQATSIDFDGLVAGQPLDIRVAALDKFDHVGAWSSTYLLTTGADATPPPVPSTPVVESYLGILTVSWDGLGSAGEVMPPDFDRVDIYASTSSGFTPSSANYVDSLRGKGVMPSTIGSYGDTYYVKLIAVDRTGNASAASAQDSATLVQAGDGDVSAVSIGKLTAGIMSALMTVSGIVRTAASGSRVELDTNGFRCYLGTTVVLDFSIPSAALSLAGRLLAGAGIGVGPTIDVNPTTASIDYYPGATTARIRQRAFTGTDPAGNTGVQMFRQQVLNASGQSNGPLLTMSSLNVWLSFLNTVGAERGSKLYLGGVGQNNGALLGYTDENNDVFVRAHPDGFLQLEASGDLQFYADGNVHSVTAMGTGGNGFSFKVQGLGDAGYRTYFDSSDNCIRFVDNASNTFVSDGAGGLKSFVIPHPLDDPDRPERWLVHVATESPEALVEYRGVAELADGTAVVELPPYFNALTEPGATVQATMVLPDEPLVQYVDQPAPPSDMPSAQRPPLALPEHLQVRPVACSTPRDGRFRIACGAPDGTRVAWHVLAARRQTFEVEPLRSDVDVRGDGPYRYIAEQGPTS